MWDTQLSKINIKNLLTHFSAVLAQFLYQNNGKH